MIRISVDACWWCIGFGVRGVVLTRCTMCGRQAQQNWASKCAAMNAMASGGQSHCSQYQQYQQGYNLDSQQGVNTFYHPGKFADNKAVQRSRQSVMNGPGSGVRVVFLGGSSGRESGTGVFLPRSFEPKKKNGERGRCFQHVGRIRRRREFDIEGGCDLE